MPIAGRVPYRQNALSSGASSSKADCSLACGNSIYGTLKWKRNTKAYTVRSARRRCRSPTRPPTSTLKGDIRIDLTSGGLGSSSSVKNLFPSNREYSSSRAFGRRDVPDRNVYASFGIAKRSKLSREEASRNYLYPTYCPFMRPITRLTLRYEIVAYEWQ
ncbi:hypothetical protein V1477_019805 [Vespula maculifrons]|uniref:Uncharacterized protein n=1 Tax=Vespula maculifrons TaxID=7453 RepID=A0ABD2ARG6_VESMC